MDNLKEIITLGDLFIILMSGREQAKDLCHEIQPSTKQMIIPIYRLN